MKKNHSIPDQFKSRNPFIVPEGYMDGLTGRIMDQLPEQPREELVRLSVFDRMKPWFYMAAAFVGLGLFFRVIVGISSVDTTQGDSLLVYTDVTYEDAYAFLPEDDYYNEDVEYLEYIETECANSLLAEEMSSSE